MRVQYPESIPIVSGLLRLPTYLLRPGFPSGTVAVSAHFSNCDKGNVTLSYFLMILGEIHESK